MAAKSGNVGYATDWSYDARFIVYNENPPGPRRTVLVPVAVPPGMNGLGSKVSSVDQVPTKARSSFISAAGLGMDIPASADFFFVADFSCGLAVKHSKPAARSVKPIVFITRYLLVRT